MREGWIESLGLADANWCIYINRMGKQQFLLHRTGNCIQYSVVNHNGKEYENARIHICVYN